MWMSVIIRLFVYIPLSSYPSGNTCISTCAILTSTFLQFDGEANKQMYMDNIDECQFVQSNIVQPLC